MSQKTYAIVRGGKAAIVQGTHSEKFQTVCDGCRQWVESIYFIVPGSKTRLCPACADKAGVGPTQDRSKLGLATDGAPMNTDGKRLESM